MITLFASGRFPHDLECNLVHVFALGFGFLLACFLLTYSVISLLSLARDSGVLFSFSAMTKIMTQSNFHCECQHDSHCVNHHLVIADLQTLINEAYSHDNLKSRLNR